MKTSSHKQLHGRQFGSALLNVAHLRAWMDARSLVINPTPEGDFIQVELMLAQIERARFEELTDEEASAILRANSHLVSNYADGLRASGLNDETVSILTGDGLQARWLCSAEAHLQWRQLIEKAVQAGELVLLDCNSKLPLTSVPKLDMVATSSAMVNGGIDKVENNTSSTDADTTKHCPGIIEAKVNNPAKTWQEHARDIADMFFDKDTNAKVRDSLLRTSNGRVRGGYAVRVMEEMQKRKIHGPRGLITNANTISKEALQGGKWWANKKK